MKHFLFWVAMTVLPITAYAADHRILGRQLLVKNPSVAEKRRIVVKAKETMSDDAIVGDPVANGATMTVSLNVGSSDTQTFTLPAGTSPTTSKPFWNGDAARGFTYKDPKGDNGPVVSAKMKNNHGVFQITLKISAKYRAVSVVPPDPGVDGCVLLTLNGGDSYSVSFTTGVVTNKGAEVFQVSKPTQARSCISRNPNNLPLDHLVILMQENRSADNYLAALSYQGQPAYEAEPLTGNPDPTNSMNPPILPFHKTTYCEVADLDHGWNGTHAAIDGGAMDGFTAINVHALDPTGSRAMGYYDQTDLPFYYGLYSTFATGDRYFASVPSQTFPNRLFLLAGTSFGYIRNDAIQLNQRSVFNLLDEASVSWRVYASQYPLAYSSLLFAYVATRSASHVFPLSQYYADLDAGTLPQVAFIDPDLNEAPNAENDEHPPADVQLGQRLVADVVQALMGSAAWASSALFLAYDEHGGFYDHVVPPAAVPPDAIPPNLQPGDAPGAFDQLGIRVPVVVVSPYAKSQFVSHVVHDHTSILRFIEYRFGLPSLTNRDAAADPMLEFFDFDAPPFVTPPSLPDATIDPDQLAACSAD